jgi:phosphoribosyl 1,2-cyclic phosphodiesterase
MSLVITSLNSGSNGNCYYIGNDRDAVLIDAGISCRETEKRMTRLGLSMTRVRAIFVSHEHSDHITGISRLSKKYDLPVYITNHTYRESRIFIETRLAKEFKEKKAIAIGSLSVTAFRKSHDAVDPHSFVVSDKQLKVGIFTDIGFSCREVIHYFRQCHAAFLEANYCEEMLANGSYPYYLKKRISSDHGHLSNAQALELFTRHRGPQLSHLVLSHLSKENNRPELVEKLFRTQAGTTNIIVASRYAETALYYISGQTVTSASTTTTRRPERVQLSLFE